MGISKGKKKEGVIVDKENKTVKLSRSLIGHILRLVIISICCLAIISTSLIYMLAQHRMEDSSHIAAEAYAKAAENYLDTYKTALQMMAMDPQLRPDATVEELTELRTFFQDKYALGTVLFIYSNGVPFDNNTLDLSEREYFKRATAGETYISSPFAKVRDGDSSVCVMASTPVNNGTNFGVITIEISLDDFNEIISGVEIGDSGYGFIMDNQGTFIAHENAELASTFTNYITLAETDSAYEGLAEDVTRMLTQQEGAFTTKEFDEGTTSYCSYCPISGTDGWIMGVVADRNEMMSTFPLAVGIVFLDLFGTVVIAIFVARKIAKDLASPIQKMASRLQELQAGQLYTYSHNGLKIEELNTLGWALKNTVDNLNGYVTNIDDTLSALSENNLDLAVTQDYAGDFGAIKESMNKIIGALNQTISRLGRVSEDVLNASEQTSSTAQALAQGATEQASAVEELLSTINSISSQVSDTACHAENANEKASAVRGEITRSNEQMQHLIGAMDDISKSSNQVAKIVKLIEDIAFQTNILALNAAVEAARAGASGKSFAVVADEVKNLATKSASAAEDTTNLIKNTIEAVNRGMSISTETAELLSGTVGAVDDMAGLVSRISDASAAEAVSINQVVQGLDQVSTVVQSNSATAEESAAVSHELANHANDLQKMVAAFKLK